MKPHHEGTVIGCCLSGGVLRTLVHCKLGGLESVTHQDGDAAYLGNGTELICPWHASIILMMHSHSQFYILLCGGMPILDSIRNTWPALIGFHS